MQCGPRGDVQDLPIRPAERAARRSANPDRALVGAEPVKDLDAGRGRYVEPPIRGEWYSPTQPIPNKPPNYDRQGTSLDDLIDFTPDLRAEAMTLVEKFRMGSIYTPPVVSQWDGPRGTLMLPHTLGGANWPGGFYDPQTKTLYIYAATNLFSLGLVNDPRRSDMNFIQGVAPKPETGSDERLQLNMAFQVRGIPAVKPPWGRITAINLNTGGIAWQVPHGETPDEVRNHPALTGVTIPRTGSIGRIGTLVTKTLLVAGDGVVFTTPSGRKGAMLRAYDKVTGREVGAVDLPAPQAGSPMTYMLDGRQHLVVATSGPGHSGELRAFRLPAALAAN